MRPRETGPPRSQIRSHAYFFVRRFFAATIFRDDFLTMMRFFAGFVILRADLPASSMARHMYQLATVR